MSSPNAKSSSQVVESASGYSAPMVYKSRLSAAYETPPASSLSSSSPSMNSMNDPRVLYSSSDVRNQIEHDEDEDLCDRCLEKVFSILF